VRVAGELHVTCDGHPTAALAPGMYACGPAAAPHQPDCKAEGPCVPFIAFEGPVDVQVGVPLDPQRIECVSGSHLRVRFPDARPAAPAPEIPSRT